MDDAWKDWIVQLPEFRVLLLSLGCFTCSCAALYFVFQIMGKSRDLVFMMCRTLLEAALALVTAFLALLFLGMLMKDVTDKGVSGLFPTAIQAYHDYVTVPLIYSWGEPLQLFQQKAVQWFQEWLM